MFDYGVIAKSAWTHELKLKKVNNCGFIHTFVSVWLDQEMREGSMKKNTTHCGFEFKGNK